MLEERFIKALDAYSSFSRLPLDRTSKTAAVYHSCHFAQGEEEHDPMSACSVKWCERAFFRR